MLKQKDASFTNLSHTRVFVWKPFHTERHWAENAWKIKHICFWKFKISMNLLNSLELSQKNKRGFFAEIWFSFTKVILIENWRETQKRFRLTWKVFTFLNGTVRVSRLPFFQHFKAFVQVSIQAAEETHYSKKTFFDHHCYDWR